jgi:hypothetical protein
MSAMNALGYHVAAFEVDGYPTRDELVYVSHAVAGRQISRFSMRGSEPTHGVRQLLRVDLPHTRPNAADNIRLFRRDH